VVHDVGNLRGVKGFKRLSENGFPGATAQTAPPGSGRTILLCMGLFSEFCAELFLLPLWEKVTRSAG
ncbi:hypothetical protein, partial [Enterococcus faecalis]|uniref:hypothetical protein n=1 Tax=Enterococcus faecalis TaxID=1351 RepID=UPI003D6B69C3